MFGIAVDNKELYINISETEQEASETLAKILLKGLFKGWALKVVPILNPQTGYVVPDMNYLLTQ